MELRDEDFRDLYLSGKRLYGDDFGLQEIEQWFADEAEGYAAIAPGSSPGGEGGGHGSPYEYAALNEFHGFRRVDLSRVRRVLGLGAFDGDELLPIARPGMEIVILEPSERPKAGPLSDVATVDWVRPDPSGVMPFDDSSFDLVTCFGVLHHIPNVSFVLSEMRRVLKPGAAALVREPISSMGDWRNTRPGLTKRERGIPLEVFRDAVRRAGFRVEREGLCMFTPVSVISRKTGKHPYASVWSVALDSAASRLARPLVRYHAEKPTQKIRPSSVFYVLTVPE